MPKKIVLCSDGTGNSAAKAEKTNVWRMFQCLDQALPSQVAYYDDGVGTSRNKYLAALGGALGWGLKRNVIDIYKFACRNYEAGAEIYGFGFSRGAFTIRMVVGLIASQGLVSFQSEEELDRAAHAAYRTYRWEKHWKWHHLLYPVRIVAGWLASLNDMLTGHRYRDVQRIERVPIRFLGVWDTVAAYEMPIVEIKRAMDLWLFPMSFGDLELPNDVREACHALALDEERETFHPTLWKEKAGDARATQVWFAGVHSNVGGGYDEDRLSYVPFGWIAERAAGAGLQLNGRAVDAIALEASAFARMYDSRAGFGALYRYAPRLDELRTGTPDPIVHWSVLLRMAEGADGYAPINLPDKFRVLAPDHTVVRLDQAVALASSSDASMKLLGEAMLALGLPEDEEVQRIWDMVWWRRVAYFTTLGCATLMALYPLVGKTLNAHFPQGRNHDYSTGIMADLTQAISAFVPTYVSPWLDAMREWPESFAFLALVFACSLGMGRLLGRRIEDRAIAAWRRRAGTYETYAAQAKAARRSLWLLTLVPAALFAFAMFDAKWSNEARWLWGAITAASAAMAFARSRQYRRLSTLARGAERIPPAGIILRIARALRTNAAANFANEAFANLVVPAAFLSFMLWALVGLANKALVSMTSAATGSHCEASIPSTVGERVGVADTLFDTRRPCWPSALFLEKGATYRIVMDMTDEWRDASHPADLGGFETDTLNHALGVSLKRWWRADWFQPIARVGKVGNDEYALAPLIPYQERRSDQAPAAERRRLVADIRPHTTGELFLYVNDALVMFADAARFYRNNHGTARVCVSRVRPDDPASLGECAAPAAAIAGN